MGLEKDLDETITAAVNARVEAAMLEALSGDEVLGQYVTAALQEKVENRRTYRTEPYLTMVLKDAIREAAKDALKAVLVEDRERIEDEVRKAIRRDAPKIAQSMVGSLVDRAASTYGLRVELQFPENE